MVCEDIFAGYNTENEDLALFPSINIRPNTTCRLSGDHAIASLNQERPSTIVTDEGSQLAAGTGGDTLSFSMRPQANSSRLFELICAF